jgi:hypothetical protein
MKMLPEEYQRYPVVAWVISQSLVKPSSHSMRDINNKIVTRYNNGKTMVDAQGLEACPFDDYDGVSCEWGPDDTNTQGEIPPVVSIIPAQPNTFIIRKEVEGGRMIDFCYEIDGVFTDYNFNFDMKKVTELEVV